MPRILLRDIADLALRPCAPYEGIGLARRAPDQDRVFVPGFQLLDCPVDFSSRSFRTEFERTRLRASMPPCIRIDGRPFRFGSKSSVEIDKLCGKGAMAGAMFPQECAQRQGLMGRRLFLDRDADPERRMAILNEGSEPLAKSAWAGKQINYAESGRQIRLLTDFIHPVYTRFRDENQDTMADIVDQQTRSRMMSGIRGKNTKPELALRRALHARGFRFRLHSSGVLGRPDLVLPKYHAVVFVHGCFWHRHEGCRYATSPSTRPEFWQAKFAANVARDSAVREDLLEAGWRVATIWECALRKPDSVSKTVRMFDEWLRSRDDQIEIGGEANSNSQGN